MAKGNRLTMRALRCQNTKDKHPTKLAGTKRGNDDHPIRLPAARAACREELERHRQRQPLQLGLMPQEKRVMTDYRTERDAVLHRWCGGRPKPNSARPSRTWPGPIGPADYTGIPIPVNLKFLLAGECLVWMQGLNSGGYGVLAIDGKAEQAHRVAFLQGGGEIPEDLQINHLCNRPYCIQPSHLYAGTIQDNRDDLEISRHEGFMSPVDIVQIHPEADFQEPMLKRLKESSRWETAEPWNSPEPMTQMVMEEFTCPGHDFRITMQTGDSKLCRICECSENDEQFYGGYSIFMIAPEIYPISQSVPHILERMATSELASEENKEWRRKVIRRTTGVGGPHHDLRTCECHFCDRDRRTIRQTIEKTTSKQEMNIIDICDRVNPKMTEILREGAADVLEEATKPLELSTDQVRELREHLRFCWGNSSNTGRPTAGMEMIIGYALYAMTEFRTMNQLEKDNEFPRFLHHALIAANKASESTFQKLEAPARDIQERLTEVVEEEGKEFIQAAYPDGRNEICERIMYATAFILINYAFDMLRYHLEGKNNSGSTWPHPHQYCIDNLLQTGKIEPHTWSRREGI